MRGDVPSGDCRHKGPGTRIDRVTLPDSLLVVTRFNIQQCPQSTWRGEDGRCHWCDNPLSGRRRVWCSEKCSAAFLHEHRYSDARAQCRRRARANCSCSNVSSRAKHQICALCGCCEREVGLLECNHRVPRRGDRSIISCLHHSTNLEMLCHKCHLGVTKYQMEQVRRQDAHNDVVRGEIHIHV